LADLGRWSEVDLTLPLDQIMAFTPEAEGSQSADRQRPNHPSATQAPAVCTVERTTLRQSATLIQRPAR